MDDWEQMRVVDLQAECRKKGLDHRGKKTDLVNRLKSASVDKTKALSNDSAIKDDNVSFECEVENLEQLQMVQEQPISEISGVELCDEGDIEIKDEVVFSECKAEEEISDDQKGVVVDVVENSESRPEIIEDYVADLQHEERRCSRKRQDRSSSKNDCSRSLSRSPPVRRRRGSPEWIVPELQKFAPNMANVHINHFNAHLNLILAENCLSASTMTDEGFRFAWGCCTGSHYIPTNETSVKLAYSVRVIELLTPGHLSQHEEEPFGLRVGWTMEENNCSSMLGEHDCSYAYCSDGAKAHNSEFEGFFEPFSVGDVVVCMATFTGDTIVIEFAKNNKLAEKAAFTIKRKDSCGLSGGKLFPQIAAKECRFEINFGQSKVDLPEGGYIWLDNYEGKKPGHIGSESKSDYEVVMMIGLPGAGKTYQTKKMLEENVEKRYWVISTDNVLQLMKVNGKQRDASSFDTFKDRASRCVNRLLDLAPSRPRNYIIDQANVYRDVQRRRLAPFKGFHRKVVVVVPEESVYQQRLAKHEHNSNIIMEMKASISLPGMDEVDEILFAEQDADDARQTIERYNKEATSKRRHDRSPHRLERYSRRSPRSSHRGHSPLERRRFSSRRDWRNDTSSRIESSRFQPRRPSRSPFRSEVYDYSRWYGGSTGSRQRMESLGGCDYYGRQRCSISPPSQRQPPSQQRTSWNLAACSTSNSCRQQSLSHSPSSFRSRPITVENNHSPTSQMRSDYTVRPFSNQQRVPQVTTGWQRTQARGGVGSSQRNPQIPSGSTAGRSHVTPTPTSVKSNILTQTSRMSDEWDSKRRDYPTSNWPVGKQGYGQLTGPHDQWIRERPDIHWSQSSGRPRTPWNNRGQTLPISEHVRWSGTRNGASQEEPWNSESSVTERSQWSAQRSAGSQPIPSERKAMVDAWPKNGPIDELPQWFSRRPNEQTPWSSDRSRVGQTSKWSTVGRRTTDDWSSSHGDSTQWLPNRPVHGPADQSRWSDARQSSADSLPWSVPNRAVSSKWSTVGPCISGQSQWPRNVGQQDQSQWGSQGTDTTAQWPRPYGALRQLRPDSDQWRPKQQYEQPMWQTKTAVPYQQQSPARPSYSATQDSYAQQRTFTRMPPESSTPSLKYPPPASAKTVSAGYQQSWQQPLKPTVQPSYAQEYSYGASVRPQHNARPTYIPSYNRPPTQTPVQAVAPQTNVWPAATRPVQVAYPQQPPSVVPQYMQPQRSTTSVATQQPIITPQSLMQQYSQSTPSWTNSKSSAVSTQYPASTPVQQQQVAAQTIDTKQYPTSGYNYSALYAVQQAYGQPTQQTANMAAYQQQIAISSQQYSTVTTSPAVTATSVTTTIAPTTVSNVNPTVQQPQIIDEATAYAGYLSVGYDQATAKAMATAYVQQQQHYYQWQQQWAAAAAAASSQQAASSTSTGQPASQQKS